MNITVQYNLNSRIISFPRCVLPSVIYFLRFCKWPSLHVASCMLWMKNTVGMLVAALMASMLSFIPPIPHHFFAWFNLHSLLAMFKSCPGLCIIHTLHWCPVSRMHYTHYDNITTSFSNIMIRVLYYIITLTTQVKQ